MVKLLYRYNAFRIRRYIRNNDVDALFRLMIHNKRFFRNMVTETCGEIKLSLNIERSLLKLLTNI